MKTSVGLSAALVHLAAGQNTAFTTVTTAATPTTPTITYWTDSSPSATFPAPPPGSTGNSGVAICGQGFTYCGYILRDHQNFREEDIVRVYCASGKDNCANGKTKTDPLQALYVCLPPQSQAIQPPRQPQGVAGGAPPPIISAPGTNAPQFMQHPAYQPHNNNMMMMSSWQQQQGGGGGGRFFDRRQAQQPALGGGGGGGLGNSGGDTCSSTPTTGNQLGLLCSCGGQCLNPKEDHIGRCDAPCV